MKELDKIALFTYLTEMFSIISIPTASSGTLSCPCKNPWAEGKCLSALTLAERVDFCSSTRHLMRHKTKRPAGFCRPTLVKFLALRQGGLGLHRQDHNISF